MTDCLLIPTERERAILEPLLPRHWRSGLSSHSVHTIGLGVVFAGIRTAEIIATYAPDQVIVAGVAGLFPNAPRAFEVGSAACCESVLLDGVGVGQGEAYQNASQLGWQQAFGTVNQLKCRLPPGVNSGPTLLTVCSGSANQQDAEWRRKRFPGVTAEDMESFSVALACHRAGVSCSVIRGFSNEVGCRDHSRWKIDKALESVASLIAQCFPS